MVTCAETWSKHKAARPRAPLPHNVMHDVVVAEHGDCKEFRNLGSLNLEIRKN